MIHVYCKSLGGNIPTSMEVIGAQTLNFKPKFKFLQLNFIQVNPSPLGGALGSLGQSLARLKIFRAQHPLMAEM